LRKGGGGNAPDEVAALGHVLLGDQLLVLRHELVHLALLCERKVVTPAPLPVDSAQGSEGFTTPPPYPLLSTPTPPSLTKGEPGTSVVVEVPPQAPELVLLLLLPLRLLRLVCLRGRPAS